MECQGNDQATITATGEEIGPVTRGRSAAQAFPSRRRATAGCRPCSLGSAASSSPDRASFTRLATGRQPWLRHRLTISSCRTYNASVLGSFVRLSERLGVTVVDRARARIELAEPAPEDADDNAADRTVIEWQGRLGVVKEKTGDGEPSD